MEGEIIMEWDGCTEYGLCKHCLKKESRLIFNGSSGVKKVLHCKEEVCHILKKMIAEKLSCGIDCVCLKSC